MGIINPNREDNRRIIIETFLAMILAIYTVLFFKLPGEFILPNYVINVLILSIVLTNFSLLYFLFKDAIVRKLCCNICRGWGKTKCTFCKKGRFEFKRNIHIDNAADWDIIEPSKNRYLVKIGENLKIVSNTLYSGRIDLFITVRDQLNQSIVGTCIINNITVIPYKPVRISESPVTIPIGDLLYHKMKTNSEPNKGEFQLHFLGKAVSIGDICGRCNGKGKGICYSCIGKGWKKYEN